MRISQHAKEAAKRIPYIRPQDREATEAAVQWAIDQTNKEWARKFKGRKKR